MAFNLCVEEGIVKKEKKKLYNSFINQFLNIANYYPINQSFPDVSYLPLLLVFKRKKHGACHVNTDTDGGN